jgi:hypothetical protein
MSDPEVLRGNDAVSALSQFSFPEESLSFFQSPGWLNLWNARPEYECGIMLARDHGDAIAYFPFCIRERYGFRECFSMPEGTYGGAVAVDNAARSRVCDAFAEWARSSRFSRVNVVEFTTRENPSFGSSEKSGHTTHVLRLNRDRDNLYANLSDNHKRNLKRTDGLPVEIVTVRSRSDIEEYFSLVQESAKRHRQPPHYSFDFYMALRDSIPEEALVWQLLLYSGKACAGHIFLKWSRSVVSWDSCSNDLARKKSLNYRLYWHNIETFCDQGCVSLNLGSGPRGAEDLVYFKAGWGAREVKYLEYDMQSPIYRTIRKAKEWLRR